MNSREFELLIALFPYKHHIRIVELRKSSFVGRAILKFSDFDRLDIEQV